MENGAERRPPPGIQAQHPAPAPHASHARRQINGEMTFGGWGKLRRFALLLPCPEITPRVLSESWAIPGLLLSILVGSWQALGLSWAAAGRVLGGSWAAPGRLGRLLDSSWPGLGGFWALLGGSVAFLGVKLEPRWTPRGTKSTPRPSKIEAKTVQNDFNIYDVIPNSILGASRGFFGAMLSEVGAPGASKMVEKPVKNQYF